MSTTDDQFAAVARLGRIALGDTGRARRVADFLLAWHNAAECGGWDLTDLWGVDDVIADDMLTVVGLVRSAAAYPDEYGLDMRPVFARWRSAQPSSTRESFDAAWSAMEAERARLPEV